VGPSSAAVTLATLAGSGAAVRGVGDGGGGGSGGAVLHCASSMHAAIAAARRRVDQTCELPLMDSR
jgi:hypothetical protein